MARKCPKCDAEIPSPRDKFCPKCGAEVPPPKQMVLSIIAIVLAGLGFLLSFVLGVGLLLGLPGLIIGVVATRREPRGKTLARIAIGISIGVIVISIIAVIVEVIIIVVGGSLFDFL